MKLQVDIEKTLGDFTLKTKFEINNDSFAILGSSGSGKTLTLKCIAGIIKPDSGRIVLDDVVLFDSKEKINVPTRDRQIGFLFQDYALFPNMTVRENIECVAKDKEKVDEMINRFGLENVQNLYPSNISGGQSQRTAIARMLITEPKLIMLDEPFSALDNYLQFRIEQEVFDIIGEFKGPVIMVSHDRNEVYRIADTIGVMDDGTLIDVQDKKHFFENPKTVVATRLTGCKNISRVEKSENKYRAIDWDIVLNIPNPIDNLNYVGFRAHYFEVVNELAENTFKCVTERIVEDTFSVSIYFKQYGNESNNPDSLLTWIVSKPKWPEVKEYIDKEYFYLKLDPNNLIQLER
ncbi:MAG: ATP-binding cassette domain-containing protein [Eubacterium sp.]|nr:ATP-binding cassette domain-containing protein [Eubacterium sp.]